MVIFNFILLFFLVEFLLVALDLSLEVILIFLVLRSQCNRLIDLLFSKTLAEEGGAVLLLCLLVHLPCQVLKSFRLVVLVHDLSTEHIDFSFGFLVLRLGLIEVELLVFDSMRLAVKTDFIKFIIDCFGSDLADVFLLLAKFVFDLLDLILDDLESTFFVLKLLSVVIDLALEASSLTLVDRVVTAAHRAS